MVIGIRGCYVEAGLSRDQPLSAMHAANEVMHRLTSQLRTEAVAGVDGFPMDALITMLFEHAESGGFTEELQWAVGRAINDPWADRRCSTDREA